MHPYSTKTLAKRIDYLVQALEKAGILNELSGHSPIADPAPWDHRQIYDPPPWDLGRLEKVIDYRLNKVFEKQFKTDPPPFDFLNIKLADLVYNYRRGLNYHLPRKLANVSLRELMEYIPGDEVTDPVPMDIAHLSIAELENQLHKINNELVRLESLKGLYNTRLKEISLSSKPKAKK